MAADYGATRQSHRGGMRTGAGGYSEAALDGGRTVVMKTTGKVAATPRGGNGRGRKPPMALPVPRAGTAPVRQKGRGAVARTTSRSAF